MQVVFVFPALYGRLRDCSFLSTQLRYGIVGHDRVGFANSVDRKLETCLSYTVNGNLSVLTPVLVFLG
jgi:hypothetical protein